jgi:mannitol/fructose-specific phosphotransferase system IIA component (Ntr-type)
MHASRGFRSFLSCSDGLRSHWFGGEPVNLIFLFAVPESEATAYLNLISGLAKLSQDHLRLRRLADAPDSRTMFEVLREIPLPKHPAVAISR